MKIHWIIAVLGLVGCDVMTAEFQGARAQEITVEGSRFKILVASEYAQITRMNFDPSPKWAKISARGERAVSSVSGCEVLWLEGDPNRMFAELDCDGDGRSNRPKRPRSRVWIDCSGHGSDDFTDLAEALAQDNAVIECIPE